MPSATLSSPAAPLVDPVVLDREAAGSLFTGPAADAARIAALWAAGTRRAAALGSGGEPSVVAVESRRGRVVLVRAGNRLAAAVCARDVPLNAARYELARALGE